MYNATKHGVTAFSEAPRQEMTWRHVRISLVEPGAVDTELASNNNRPGIRAEIAAAVATFELLVPGDVAEAVSYIVTRPRRWQSTSCCCARPSRRASSFPHPGCPHAE